MDLVEAVKQFEKYSNNYLMKEKATDKTDGLISIDSNEVEQ